MTRVVAALFLALAVFAQKPQDPVEPPEEDASLKTKEYSLNPLQAEKEYKIGLYYAKKKSWRAAANRFEEAVKWNPGLADAHYKRAEMLEHLGNKDAAQDAWKQFLEVAPDDKRAPDVQKKIKQPSPPKS